MKEQEYQRLWQDVMGLSTIIGRTDRDYSGNRIDSSLKFTIDRLRMLDHL
jgi:hypothetical protein